MNASDFEYDGYLLSDHHFVVCEFEYADGVQIIDAGSKITFTKVSNYSGKKGVLINTKYEECVQATFDICKDPEIFDKGDGQNEMVVTDTELLQMMRWLNRREFRKFSFIYEGNRRCCLNASFNIEKIVIEDKTYGLRLTMETDKPFGYRDDADDQTLMFSSSDVSNEAFKVFYDESEEIGYQYPDLVITCNAAGSLSLHNAMTGCTMTISNCSNGEVITIRGDEQIITSNLQSHDIYNCFNWQFFSIGNTLNNKVNHITCSLPAFITVSYLPVVKLL